MDTVHFLRMTTGFPENPCDFWGFTSNARPLHFSFISFPSVRGSSCGGSKPPPCIFRLSEMFLYFVFVQTKLQGGEGIFRGGFGDIFWAVCGCFLAVLASFLAKRRGFNDIFYLFFRLTACTLFGGIVQKSRALKSGLW